MAYRQVNNTKRDERLRFIMDLISKGYLTYEIVSLCQKEWNIGRRQIEKYLSHVYKFLNTQVNEKDKEKILLEYSALIKRCELSGDHKLAKEYRFQRDKILGIAAPVKQDITSDGKAINFVAKFGSQNNE